MTMTSTLQRVIEELSKRPKAEQEAIAAIILEELADEERWQARFAATRDKLARLAEQALADLRAGDSLPLDFDRR